MINQSGSAVRRVVGTMPSPQYNSKSWRASALVCSMAVAIVIALIPATAEASGQDLFSQQCSACHTLSSDRLVGPGLEGVVDERDQEWLIRKIVEPDALIAEGDPITEELVEEYGSQMPNLGVSRSDAETIADFLGAGDGQAMVADFEFTQEQVERGAALFEGSERFENRGVSCNACHHVEREGVFGGGSLAADITEYGAQGVDAMLRNPPFPKMRVAYEDRPLTDEEIESLQAFLQDVAQDPEEPRPYGGVFLAAGLAGMVIMIAFFSVIWSGRRRQSVYQDLYDRQIKSR